MKKQKMKNNHTTYISMWKSIAFATCLALYSVSGVAVNPPAQDSVPESGKMPKIPLPLPGG